LASTTALPIMRTAALLSAAALVHADTTCFLTDRSPAKARYLKFCQDYNAEACCVPGHDLENQVQFENLIEGLGPGCKNPMMYPELRYFYCLGCDPDQPLYSNNATGEIRVCKSFVDKLWADPAYTDCGVMYPNPCPANWVDDGMDPYTCGDDLLLPKSVASWQGTTGREDEPSGIAFMNVFKPPGLGDDWEFVEVPDEEGNCWNAPAFKNSGARLASSTGVGIMLVGMALRRLL